MLVITINYTCKFRLKFAPSYVFTSCGLCYNLKTGRLIKQVYNSSCIGYTINGKFKSLTYLKKQLEKIPNKKYCPFSNNTIEI
jgi:hypothetical protein